MKRNGSTERTGRDKDAFYVADNSTEMFVPTFGASRSVVIIVNAIRRLPFRSCNARALVPLAAAELQPASGNPGDPALVTSVLLSHFRN